MRTVVARGNDALSILFEAAAHQEQTDTRERHPSPPSQFTPESSITAATRIHDVQLSPAAPETLKVWRSCRFVKQGWISAEEAITYVDLFFKHMCPLSPIISHFYGEHRNQRLLLNEDPTLCCTILMISSRYYILPGVGGISRGYIIHDRLWKHCQHLITRTLFGQDKGLDPKTRSIGTIEALLLISEWHPRSLHFPPDDDGWDSNLVETAGGEGDEDTNGQPQSSSLASSRWLEDVIEPARRSDRMSWMLLGSAMTLAHELGIFDENMDAGPGGQSIEKEHSNSSRRMRARKLLYVYINHLASRLGYVSLIPPGLSQIVMRHTMADSASASQWQSHMIAWIELTKLVKSVSDTFFPSPAHTRQLLHTGRYVSLLEDHFLPLLDHWKRTHLDSQSYQGSYQDTLFIEHQYVRIYINSLGMQAACERALSEMNSDPEQANPLRNNADEVEYVFIQEVIDGSCTILQKVISLAETDTLRFAPVRIFMRITTSSIFLLKALSLGVRNAKLQSSLDILSRSIHALKASNLDDIHLAARYATLLDVHVQRLRQGFERHTQKQLLQSNSGATRSTPDLASMDQGMTADSSFMQQYEMPADAWFSLPFDPSMAPFAQEGTADFSSLNAGALDFIWNLPLQ